MFLILKFLFRFHTLCYWTPSCGSSDSSSVSSAFSVTSSSSLESFSGSFAPAFSACPVYFSVFCWIIFSYFLSFIFLQLGTSKEQFHLGFSEVNSLGWVGLGVTGTYVHMTVLKAAYWVIASPMSQPDWHQVTHVSNKMLHPPWNRSGG